MGSGELIEGTPSAVWKYHLEYARIASDGTPLAGTLHTFADLAECSQPAFCERFNWLFPPVVSRVVDATERRFAVVVERFLTIRSPS